ncbi:Acyl carrier protein [Pandoraea cepalis]|uniref:Acyl carrier protein n=1 Tax=Pandoraea cepalis TaxID=2508294 RepID=A0A5E4X045_9BURK|nr:phosphopantetheine-binding protein [Pandoraea cepalis]VVE29662.1 Acyl carrier protein [Pandoraea cepalis]
MKVEEKLKEILVNNVYVETPMDEIGRDDSLRDVLGVDSIGFVELKEQIESSFSVTIEDDEFTPENFRTIATIEALIARLQVS